MFPHQYLFPQGARIYLPPHNPHSNYVTGWKIRGSISDRARDSPSVRDLILDTRQFVGFFKWNLISELFSKSCAASLSFLNICTERFYWGASTNLCLIVADDLRAMLFRSLRFVKLCAGTAVRLWWASVQVHAHVYRGTCGVLTVIQRATSQTAPFATVVYLKVSRLSLGLSHPSIQWGPGALPGCKAAEAWS